MADDYYGSSNGFGMWNMPANFEGFDKEYRFRLVENLPSAMAEERERLTEYRTSNHKEATYNTAVDVAQEARCMARQAGMMTVDASASTVNHFKGLVQSDLSQFREPVRVVPKDLALETLPTAYPMDWAVNRPATRLLKTLAPPNQMQRWLDTFSNYELGQQVVTDPNEFNLMKFDIKYRKLVSWAMASYPFDNEAPFERAEALTKWICKCMKFTLDHWRQGDRRKSLSHLGGFLADYINSEMDCRAGLLKPNKKWRVVVNGTYRHIIWKLTATKDNYLNADERATWNKAIEDIQKDDPLGDVLEIGVALAMFNNEPQDIMMLMETVLPGQ